MAYGPPPGPLPMPPPRPRRSRRTLFIVLAVVAVVCCGGVGVGGYLVVRTFLNVTEPVREETRAFLGDLRDGDNAGAYDRLCFQAQARYDPAEFDQAVEAFGLDRVVGHSFTGVNINGGTGGNSGSVTARLDLDDGDQFTHTFPLVEEGDDWKICGDPF